MSLLLDRRLALLLAGLLLACEGERTPDGADDGPPESAPPERQAETGQTGSPGGLECVSADALESRVCRDGIEQAAAALRAPASFVRTFTRASCEPLSVQSDRGSASGSSCVCYGEDNGSISVGPRGVGCFALGRAGECLYDDHEFAGCTLGAESAQCEQVCGELGARFARDAARVHETEVLYASCDQNRCRGVLRVDQRCVVYGAIDSGRSYDCALGAAAILAAHDQDVTPPRPPPAQPGVFTQPSVYREGTLGFVELGVSSYAHGARELERGFGGFAQFFELEGGGTAVSEVVDPLSGLDDCGVSRMPGGAIVGGPSPRFFRVTSAELRDGDTHVPFLLTDASNQWFASYGLDLQQHEPRYGEPYSVRVEGEKLGAVELSITLPESLTITSLTGVERVERGALPLAWTGRNDAPLWLSLSIDEKLADVRYPYRIDCLLRDDGAFTIPAEVLAQAPSGFVTATFSRERAELGGPEGARLLARGKVAATHQFVLGEACPRADVLAACERHAAYVRELAARCGAPPPAESTTFCPAYLAEACGGCSAYYDCASARLECGDGSLVWHSGCACD